MGQLGITREQQLTTRDLNRQALLDSELHKSGEPYTSVTVCHAIMRGLRDQQKAAYLLRAMADIGLIDHHMHDNVNYYRMKPARSKVYEHWRIEEFPLEYQPPSYSCPHLPPEIEVCTCGDAELCTRELATTDQDPCGDSV